ncbi:MAG: hypothetical protein H0V61_02290 [Chitinophagales bacterium]|nr:hypothetical protein [Chitinophagales bacterium]
MKTIGKRWLFLFLIIPCLSWGQKPLKVKYTKAGIFSLGMRIPFGFSRSYGILNVAQGLGIESRIQLGKHYNTEYYGDYLLSKQGDSAIRSNGHIGASFLLYPQDKLRRVQPFVFAGPDADFEKIHQQTNASNAASRWNFAAHAGLGMHLNISWRSDITLSTAYMLHFGNKIGIGNIAEQPVYLINGTGTDGHLLFTISMNFKIIDLWKKLRW